MKKISLILAMMMAFAVCFSGCTQAADNTGTTVDAKGLTGDWERTSEIKSCNITPTVNNSVLRVTYEEAIKAAYQKLNSTLHIDDSNMGTYATLFQSYEFLAGEDEYKDDGKIGNFPVQTKIISYSAKFTKNSKSIIVEKESILSVSSDYKATLTIEETYTKK